MSMVLAGMAIFAVSMRVRNLSRILNGKLEASVRYEVMMILLIIAVWGLVTWLT